MSGKDNQELTKMTSMLMTIQVRRLNNIRVWMASADILFHESMLCYSSNKEFINLLLHPFLHLHQQYLITLKLF